MIYVIYVLIGLSVFFALAGVIGMLRMQSSTNISTFGVLGVIIGGILYCIFFLGNAEMAVKLFLMGVFYIITSPISGHAIAKGAYRHGVKPCDKIVCDKYGEDLE